MSTIEVKVPDIGDFTDVPVIDVFVKPGDAVQGGGFAGYPRIRQGDDGRARTRRRAWSRSSRSSLATRSSEGTVILDARLRRGGAGQDRRCIGHRSRPPPLHTAPQRAAAKTRPRAAPAGAATVDATAVKVPDIGDFKDVPVIEVFVKVGDTVKAEDSLVSLESEKATMDVPAPSAGAVKRTRRSSSATRSARAP